MTQPDPHSSASACPGSRHLRVGLLVDSEVVSAGLRRLLAPMTQIEVQERLHPDCDVVVVDGLAAPGLQGRPRQMPPGVCVVGLHPDGARPQSDPDGPARWIPISANAATLVHELQAAYTEHQAALDSGEKTENRSRGADLTRREDEILRLICAGHTNLEIADLAFLSVNSIKTHIRSLYRKIGASRRSQAVAWGLDHGY